MFDDVTKSVRVLSAAAVERANSGHPGMPLGMADIGVVLYKNFLKVSNKHPDWINRDRFVLSAQDMAQCFFIAFYTLMDLIFL